MDSDTGASKTTFTAESNDVAYEFTATTFRKTSKNPLPILAPTAHTFSRNHDRISNEACALTLVAQHTTIPVRKHLDHGKHTDSRQYLVTQLVPGVILSTLRERPCSRPPGSRHPCLTADAPCATGADQVEASVMLSITNVVLPQLSPLRSKERGISGFVMPPSWLNPDGAPPWVGMSSFHAWPLKRPDYVLQHGDLAAYNILINPLTSEVTALIDWEYAGYYPEGMELWPGTLNEKAYYSKGGSDGVHLAADIARFLPDKRLETYKA